jgi:hypothetical protein
MDSNHDNYPYVFHLHNPFSKDTTQFAINFQNESPIKKGRATSTDIDLIDRIIGQLQSALQDVNQIFFMIPTKERMVIIEQDRKLKQIIKMKVIPLISEQYR